MQGEAEMSLDEELARQTFPWMYPPHSDADDQYRDRSHKERHDWSAMREGGLVEARKMIANGGAWR